MHWVYGLEFRATVPFRAPAGAGMITYGYSPETVASICPAMTTRAQCPVVDCPLKGLRAYSHRLGRFSFAREHTKPHSGAGGGVRRTPALPALHKGS